MILLEIQSLCRGAPAVGYYNNEKEIKDIQEENGVDKLMVQWLFNLGGQT